MPTRKTSRTIAIVGAGRVGTALALALRRRRHVIAAVVSRSPASARRLARAVRSPHALTTVAGLPSGINCLLITTPDEAIASVASEIAAHPLLRFEALTVLHTSGPLTSDVLFPLAQRGARTFSLHPIQTFPERMKTVRESRMVDGIWYGYEGPERYQGIAGKLVKEMDGRMTVIPKEQKILYHVACVFASNYTTALLGAAKGLAEDAGIPSLEPLRRLIETSTRNALERGPGKAMSGPLVRGSAEVIQQHLNELAAKRRDLAGLYAALALFGLNLAAEEGRLSREEIKRVTEALTGIS